MVNTVPNGVNLTDPIAEPFDYVVSEPYFSYQNGTFIVSTSLRVGTYDYPRVKNATENIYRFLLPTQAPQ